MVSVADRGTRHSPKPTLRQWMASCREADVERYLVVREAFLSLQSSSVRLVKEGDAWVPSFQAGSQEVLRVLLGRRGDQAPPAKLLVTVPRQHLAAVARAVDLGAGTRRRLLRAAETKGKRCALPLRGEEDVAEGVAVALLLHARLAGAP